ncbi:MAG: peptidoglycan DD-metalloendopeptidase family protein [Pseudomonadota bacterium]
MHDYKPRPSMEKKGPAQKLRWFFVGLGVPLVALALITGEDTEPEPIKAHSLAQETKALPLPELDLPATLDTPEEIALPLEEPPGVTQILKVESGDSLDWLFKKHELSRKDLANIMLLSEAKKTLPLVKPGEEIVVRHEDGKILELRRSVSETLILVISQDEDGVFKPAFEAHPIETRIKRAHAVIENSLFLAAMEVGMSHNLTMNLAGVFAWDVDFMLDIRSKDEFSLIYEEVWQDGEYLRDGEIIAAEFVNNGDVHRAVRYEDPNGNVDYFTPEGLSVRKAFIRAPVDFTRISSRFNPNRRHPILNKIRAHRGVDYAAPSGTPIKAAGDGKVIFRGKKSGYGNTLILQHGGNITTLYAHLSRYAKPRYGTRVKQGQVIGYVGMTGLATAPHLHYEYRLNGVHRNPRTVALPKADPINKKYLADFETKAEPLLSQLDMIKKTRLASVQ